ELRSRPVLGDPQRMVTTRDTEISQLLTACRAHVMARLRHDTETLRATHGHLRALSPLGTLQRGYAVIRPEAGRVVRAPGEVSAGQALTARLASGGLGLTVTSLHDEDPSEMMEP